MSALCVNRPIKNIPYRSLNTGSIIFCFLLGSSQTKIHPCGWCHSRFRCRYRDFHNAERVPKVHRYKNLKDRHEKRC
nr:MAG TPA: Polycomb protein [Caudoviricetes sp.]